MKQDDYKITDENKIAWCACCTLASYFKPCKNGENCPFNIGLPFRAAIKQEKRLEIDLAPIKRKVLQGV